MCDELFKSVQELSKNEEKFKREFLVTCSYLEIYNEKIQDLLNPTDRKLEVKGTKKTGMCVACGCLFCVCRREGRAFLTFAPLHAPPLVCVTRTAM